MYSCVSNPNRQDDAKTNCSLDALGRAVFSSVTLRDNVVSMFQGITVARDRQERGRTRLPMDKALLGVRIQALAVSI